MRFITFFLYLLKINVLNVIVLSCRTELLLFIDSSAVYGASASTQHPEDYPDVCFANNVTGVPI